MSRPLLSWEAILWTVHPAPVDSPGGPCDVTLGHYRSRLPGRIYIVKSMNNSLFFG